MRNFLLLIAFGLLAVPAWGQTTAVTGQVLDPLGHAYAGAQINISFVPSPTATTVPLINGSTFNTTVPVVQADSFGNFTTTLIDNALVSDGHTGGVASKWAFFIRSASVCFAGNTVGFSDTLTITGASQNVTASLQAAAATLPSCGGSGGGGNVIGCTTVGGVAFQNGTNNTLTCGATLTWADGANAVGVFQGPATSTLSANLNVIPSITGIPESQTNYHLLSSSAQTLSNGSNFLAQSDKDQDFIGMAVITDATNLPTSDNSGFTVNSYINVPTGQTNVSPSLNSIGGGSVAYGAGTITLLSGFVANNLNQGTGTVTSTSSFTAVPNGNIGGGVLHNSYGFDGRIQDNVGDTLNAEFFGEPSTASGVLNWVFYNTLGLSKFDQTFVNALTLTKLVMSNTAPTIAAAGCGGAGAAIIRANGTAAFEISVGTSNTGSCTVTMPVATGIGWACTAIDGTTTSANVFLTKSLPTSSNVITLQNYTTAAATHAWVDTDVLVITCTGLGT